MENKRQQAYYNLCAEEVEKQLQTSIEKGLTGAEAHSRLEKYGYNEFEKTKHKSAFAKFISQFRSFMILVLLVAAAISGVVGYLNGEGFTDAIIILVIVILNAIIGTVQETKAEKSLDALEKMAAPRCKVIRDGQVHVVPSREIVPGDIIVLDTGDAVPADIRLIEAVNLKIEEAALTGESIPEEKFTHVIESEVPLGDRDNLAFSSCTVTYGRGKGIVIETAMRTEVGKIASMIQSVPDTKTPMQKRLDQLGKILGIGALIICAIIFVVGLLQGREIIEMFMIAVSLAAAAIPEGLPAVSTIVLAVGVQRLAKKNAIVRNLPSVETLGSTTVICSDKTGTLTQNRMTIVKFYNNGNTTGTPQILNIDERLMLEAAILANDAKMSNNNGAWVTTGDPTETALLDIGIKFGLLKNDMETESLRIAEIPFDSERKMMTTVNKQTDGSLRGYTKGGLDEVLACCTNIQENGTVRTLTDTDLERIKAANIAMASDALRVLAFAYIDLEQLPGKVEPATLEKDLTYIGMAGMIDPPRMEVKDAVSKCLTAGIKPVMITGDHKITAVAIAEQLNIKQPEEEAITGINLQNMTDEELDRNVENIAVYARVAPEHKVRIVQAFQKNGEIVAMTGDGVNDAPALKLADIGVAMGVVGTDVSKEAADVVLADDNFSTIVVAIEEGRRIYDNILKAIQFMLSTNVGELLVLFIAVLANWASPLLPIHILWINLVTDSLPALALSVDPAEKDIMQRKPIDSRQGIMAKPFALRILLQGMMIGGLSLAALRIGMQTSVDVAQTMTFAVLAFTQITHVLNVRSPRHSAFRNMFTNKYLWGALAIVVALMLVVIEIPSLHELFHLASLNTVQWMWVIGLSLAPLPIVELVKGILRLRK